MCLLPCAACSQEEEWCRLENLLDSISADLKGRRDAELAGCSHEVEMLADFAIKLAAGGSDSSRAVSLLLRLGHAFQRPRLLMNALDLFLSPGKKFSLDIVVPAVHSLLKVLPASSVQVTESGLSMP